MANPSSLLPVALRRLLRRPALAGALRSQFWRIAPADPLELLAIVLQASAALRAARTDPVAVLRAD